ncbi:MAG: type II toxin-antitoxin system HicB family antitoxin [Cyanobacteria bacterium TGS_CYA1]|nr:type II toxin-antitoxin system HicB family antitoxin [Cyanobacteria bacterium TGS_CYA1]
MKNDTYTVVFELDDTTGWWAISVKQIPGCYSQSKSLTQGRIRIREALSLSVDNAYEAEFVEELVLPQEVCRALKTVEKVHEKQRRLQLESQRTTAKVASLLNRKFNCGMLDIGELMGLSHQRIGQLTQTIEE